MLRKTRSTTAYSKVAKMPVIITLNGEDSLDLVVGKVAGLCVGVSSLKYIGRG